MPSTATIVGKRPRNHVEPSTAPPGLAPPIAIAADRCKACELCVTACPHGVLALDRTRVNLLGHHPIHLTDAAGCTSCAICARVCPDAVFTIFRPIREP
jgi:2-oxoglutarate ferredoxin oxidoreductase subunit delta